MNLISAIVMHYPGSGSN